MVKGILIKWSNFYRERFDAELKSYPDATAKELKLNIQFLTQIHTTDTVVTHGGWNDISTWQNQEKRTQEEIENEIINIGSYCRDKGVNEIIISGLICPKGQYGNSSLLRVNNHLQKFHFEDKFYFIDNSKTKRDHLFRDGLNLLQSCKVILAKNCYYLN